MFSFYKVHLPLFVMVIRFLSPNVSSSIVIEVYTILSFVHHLQKFEFIDHV